MTTETSDAVAERQERLARLAERRGQCREVPAAPKVEPPRSGADPAPRRSTGAKRKSHPAVNARIAVAGASVSATFGLVAVIGLAAQSAATPATIELATVPPAPTTTQAQVLVLVRQPDGSFTLASEGSVSPEASSEVVASFISTPATTAELPATSAVAPAPTSAPAASAPAASPVVAAPTATAPPATAAPVAVAVTPQPVAVTPAQPASSTSGSQ